MKEIETMEEQIELIGSPFGSRRRFFDDLSNENRIVLFDEAGREFIFDEILGIKILKEIEASGRLFQRVFLNGLDESGWEICGFFKWER